MYTFPFTEETVRDELNGTMVMANSYLVNGQVMRVKELNLSDGCWEIDGGALQVLGERGKPLARFNSLSVKSGRVFLSGDSIGTVGMTGRVQSVLYERRELGEDFHVVVSSHHKYGDALSRVVRSLRREGIGKDQLTVVVAGVPEGVDVTESEDYNRIDEGVSGNLMGCTGLHPLLDGAWSPSQGHVVLLHDTCEVVRGFADAVRGIDVGLPFDMVTMDDGHFAELGLWSVDFLKRVGGTPGFNMESWEPYVVPGLLRSYSKLYRKFGTLKPKKKKDVYGSGVQRRVMESDEWCLKKYVGSKQAGGRP